MKVTTAAAPSSGGGRRGGSSTGSRHGPDRARADRGHRGAELMARADPSVDDAGIFAAERFARETHGRRHRRDPVKAVEHREPSESTGAVHQREREKEERHASENV